MKLAAPIVLFLIACVETPPEPFDASNGVTSELAAAGGDVAINGDAVFHTDTGVISGAIDRAGGTGVIAGIGFTSTDSTGVLLGVFGFRSLTISPEARIRFVGAGVPVFAVAGDAMLGGTIDLAGGCNGATTCAGPGGGTGSHDSSGSSAQGCGPGGPGVCAGTMSGHACLGGGGGAGGANGRDGFVSNVTTGLGPAALGGMACSSIEPLVGGSGGGRGTSYLGGPGGGSGTAGGGGGGALQVTAFGSLIVSGAIDADGASGDVGGQLISGGGGGGGGTILLESARIEVLPSAEITAESGSGGYDGNNGAGSGGAGGAGLVHLRGHAISVSGVVTPTPTTSE